ncbi:MAG: MATE family efflux transporter [Lachnospiraceae bacterium]|nr:MATE family efflux transporter [Lachnospiraceae bacterium]
MNDTRLTDEEKRDRRYKELTEGKLYPLLVKMAIPSMIGMMVATVYSMTDTYFVGKLNNTDMTAAVGIVYTFISVVQAIGFWFGYGSGNYISRMLGKKEIENAKTMAAKGVILGLITGVVILILGIIFVKPLAFLLGGSASQGVLDATVSYLKITVISVPFMIISNILYNELRLAASSRASMTGLLVGMLINMILDPVFIHILNMGIQGAAYASLIGQIMGVIVLWRSTGRDGNVPIELKRGRPDRFHTMEILKGGAPNFCRQGISSISSVLLNRTAGMFGVNAIAAITIAVRIAYICYALVIGFGQGFQPVCAINYGAGKYARLKRAFKLTLMTVTVFLIASSALIYFNSGSFVYKFTRDENVIPYATDMLKAQLIIMPFMGYYILIGMLLQNIGKFGRATMVTISENGLFLIPSVIILPQIFGLNGLIWCKPVASILALGFSVMIGFPAWHQFLNTDNKKENEE